MDKDVRKHSGLLKLLAVAGVLAVLVPSIATASNHIQAVRVTGTPTVKGTVTSKIKDTGGGRIESRSIPKYGTFGATGSAGAVDTWKLEGAFLGYMHTLGATQPVDASTLTIPAAGGKSELHRLVFAENPNHPAGNPGNMSCTIQISTDAITQGGVPVPLLEATYTQPTVLESPLRITDDLHLELIGANTNCGVGVIGIAPQTQLLAANPPGE